MSISEEKRKIFGEMIMEVQQEEQEEALKSLGVSSAEGPKVKDDSHEAIDFYGDEALAKWVMVMSDGRYGRGMASAAQL